MAGATIALPVRPSRISVRRRWVARVGSATLIALIFAGILPRVVDLSAVWTVVTTDVTLLEAGVMAAFTAASLAASFLALMAVLPGLGFARASLVNVTTTSVAYTVPAGGAAATGLTAVMLRSFGYDASAVAGAILVTGVWNLAVRVGLPVAAFALVAGAEEAQAAALLGLLVLAAMAALVAAFFAVDAVAARIGQCATRVVRPVARAVGRPVPADMPERVQAFRRRTAGLVRRTWPWLTAGTLGYHLGLFGVLYAALHAVDATAELGVLETLVVFAVARQATALPITPGSVGVVELALIAGLGVAGGDVVPVTAGVLIYRAFTYLLYLPAGIPAYLVWRLRSPGGAAADVPPGQPSARRVRRPADVARLAVAAGATALLSLAGAIGDPSALEADVFRLVNGLPDGLGPVLWTVMQLGWIGAVVVAAGYALVRRRPALAGDLALAGSAAWIVAKLVKALDGRPRPGALLSDVLLRADATVGGVGFPAGHTAVAAALATVATAGARRRLRWTAAGAVAAVGLARVFTGAHLPLDVIGGAALGWAVGLAVRLARGSPVNTPGLDAIVHGLAPLGIDVVHGRVADGDVRGAVPFTVVSRSGDRYFVKAIGHDQWDADVVHRAWRWFAYREAADEAPFATPKQQLEHEAYLLALARRAGVRVPRVVSTAATEGHTWLLVLDHAPGESMEAADAGRLGDAVRAAWSEVCRLHGAGIAHRDLRLANVMLDDAGRPTLVAFGHAEASAGAAERAADVAELLTGAALRTGVRAAVAAAHDVLGGAVLRDAASRLQPLALTPQTRRAARRRPHLLEDLVEEIASVTGAPVAADEPLLRPQLQGRTIVGALVASLVVYEAVVAVSGVGPSLRALTDLRASWLVAAAGALLGTYVAATVTLLGAVDRPLALGRTFAVQLAASAASKLQPPGLGSLRTNSSYLRALGMGPRRAADALLATRLAGLAVHGVLLAAAATWVVARGVRTGAVSWRWLVLVAFAVAVALAGIVVWGSARRRMVAWLLDRRGDVPVGLSSRRSMALFGGAAALTVCSTAAFAAVARGVGLETPFAAMAVLYLLMGILAPLGPLPGGVGVVEPALAGGLMVLRAPAGEAAAAVVLFRLLTYWLPLPAGWLSHARLPAAVARAVAPLPPAAIVGRHDGPTPDARPVAFYRHPADAVRLLAGVGLGLSLAVFAAGGLLLDVEADAFRIVNDLPDAVFAPVNLVMQAGWVGAVPLVAAVAFVARRRRLALDVALGGTTAWLLAKVVKALADRGRPDALLDEVVLRGVSEGGLGFVSGHSAVAAAIATVVSAHVARPIRWFLWGVALAVGASRVYVGAHFPLDVVAGLALGWAVGSLVHLLRGTPAHLPRPAVVVAALRRVGLPVTDLERVPADARGSIPYTARLADGRQVFVKAMGRDQRDADVLFKLWRFVAYRDTEDEAPFVSPRRQIEHEAYLTALARTAGVAAPDVMSTIGAGDGVWLLVMEHLRGGDLGERAGPEVDDGVLDALWREVRVMHGARIAHRDLRLANVLVGTGSRPWIVDFGFAEAGAGHEHLARDTAELLVSTALAVGPRRAVASAVRVLGADAAWAAAPYVQPYVLARATRLAARRRPSLLAAVRAELAASVGRPPAPPEQVTRSVLPGAAVAPALVASVALVYATTVWAGAGDALGVTAVSARWLAGAVLAVAAAHLAGGAALAAAAGRPLAYGRAVAAGAVASYTGRLAPLGGGAPAVTALYLRRHGMGGDDAEDASHLLSRSAVAAFAGALLGIVTLVAVAGVQARAGRGSAMLAAAAASVVSAVLAAVVHRRTIAASVTALARWVGTGADRRRLVRVVGYSAMHIGGLAAAATMVARGVGVELAGAGVVAAYLGGTGAGALARGPGRLVLVDAATVGVLVLGGVPPGVAVGAAIAVRVVVFWLPMAAAAVAARALHVWQAPEVAAPDGSTVGAPAAQARG